ncbi:PREDICTED: ly6/PLAUR domain-containing protein 5-like [Gekko japonicus]|uniref:Ly6/PLAUR domain-containing protein 5-like n=1 Tax=Gekko japonicus TaxID=146911 RepID=A0ABM1KGU5_GEKJA|nr:PREDICTED: ly6/PLAUR domain-containing protein 5-like [Gekko japonicus]
MEGARLKWRRTTTAALLGLLPFTLLIPGAFALRCHSSAFIGPVSRDPIGHELSLGIFSNCSSSENACAEAILVLSTGETALLVAYRGCATERLKTETGSSTSGHQHLTVHSSVRYCRSDLCNREPIDLDDFKRPDQENASEANSFNRCYSGFKLNTDQDILDRETCGRDQSQCYHGTGSITAGNFTTFFEIKTCQGPSCNVPESQSFGPIELRLRSSCCHGMLCNGKVVASQVQANSTTAPAQNATRPREEDDLTHPTVSPEHSITNDTNDAFAVPEEVTVTPDYESDSNTTAGTRQNPLYDYEENDNDTQSSVSTNNTLNPRASNLGPSMPSLPFDVLLVALGIVILRIW